MFFNLGKLVKHCRTFTKNNGLNRINNISFNNITAVVKVQQPFEEALKKLEGENYPTMHFVYKNVLLIVQKRKLFGKYRVKKLEIFFIKLVCF